MSAPGFITHSRSFVELLARWGSARLSTLGPLFAGVLPVVVVDRFRGPDEGNIWVITAETAGAPLGGEFSAVGIASTDENSDWELLAVSYSLISFFTVLIETGFHITTPLAGIVDPVANNLLTGFQPGIITDLPVTFSTLRGFSGTSPALVAPLGEVHRPRFQFSAGNLMIHQSKLIEFDPPLRVYGAGRGIVLQSLGNSGTAGVAPLAISGSFRFRERPRRANL